MLLSEQEEKMKRFFQVVPSRAFILFVTCTLFLAANGQAQQPGEDGESPDYCLLQVGDLNGDGTGDHVVTRRGPPRELALTYVFLKAKESLPESFDQVILEQEADYILQGPAAAPFSCPDTENLRVVPSPSTGAIGARSRGISPQAILPASSPVNPPVRYKVTDLETLTSFTSIMATGINAAGQVTGQARTTDEYHAIFHDGEQLHDLGTLGGHSSMACALNNSGEIVGYSLTGETDEAGFVDDAFRSNGFSIASLGIRWSHAFGNNDRGQIAGDMRVDSGAWHALLYQNGKAKDLGTLDGTNSFAFAVNDAGRVVGEADTFIPGKGFPSNRAFIYRNGKMEDLGSLGYFCYRFDDDSEDGYCFERSSATDINNRDQISGFSSTKNQGFQHAILITKGKMEDLGTLGGNQSWGQAVNDSGQVVGSSLTTGDAAYQAFLYDRKTMYDLKDLVVDPPAGFSMWEARDINNFGQIVGLNYLLDPLYESIAPGGQFAYSGPFGQGLNFEYWIEAGDKDRCVAPWAFARVEIRIEGVILDQKERSSLGGYLNRWLPADRFAQICSASGEWRKGSLKLPESLKDRTATVRFRLRQIGAGEKPTVYLRHFASE
jgi:probable HAF family extracellular repeat protein